MLERVPADVPTMLRYNTFTEKNSMFNTPACFAIYTINLVLKWLEETVGGLESMARINHPAGPPDAREWLPNGTQAYACAESLKMDRATLGGMRPSPKAAYYRRMPVSQHVFDPMALQRFGK